jgi:hypothetical protein
MTLNKREKTIAIFVCLLAVAALYYLWPSNEESLADLRTACDKLSGEVKEKEDLVLRARKAKERLAALQRVALPADPKEAARQYNNWLSTLAHKYFKNVTITPQEPQNHRGIYVGFVYTINCQSSLDQLTQFLYAFYSAGHLHKIRSMNITPQTNPSELGLTISVEALSLPGSKQTDKLSAEPSKRLKLASVDAYKKTIVGRNLFIAYAPPKNHADTKENKPPAKVDPLEFSYLTAIIEADGVPEAWLFERTTGKTLKVHQGDDFTIGKVKGKVNRIGYNDIDIEIDGQVHTVGYGNNLKM